MRFSIVVIIAFGSLLATPGARAGDAVSADALVRPSWNWEIFVGDSIAPEGIVSNRSDSELTFMARLRFINAVTAYVVYDFRDTVVYLPAHASRHVAFPRYVTQTNQDKQIGRFVAEFVAEPITPDSTTIPGDDPSNDTIRSTFFAIKRLDPPFIDYNSKFTLTLPDSLKIPNALQWVSNGVTVVDGDLETLDPPPPRGLQGVRAKLNSPVMRLDRRDLHGREYDPCRGVGSAPMHIGSRLRYYWNVPYDPSPLADGAAGDTLESYPIDLKGRSYMNPLTFSIQRGGRLPDSGHSPLAGPEATIADSTGSRIYRFGDSLILEYADPAESTNVRVWHRMWALDGGLDNGFRRYAVPIDSPYLASNFRFRFRLQAKNDGPTGADDDDAWYIDAIDPTEMKNADIGVTSVGWDWPYFSAPARQRAMIRPFATVYDNSTQRLSGFGVAFFATMLGRSDVYLDSDQAVVGHIDASSSLPVPFKQWDATMDLPGTYILGASIRPKQYDSEQSDDTTYTISILREGPSLAYDRSVNDLALLATADTGLGFHDAGAIALRFDLARSDSIGGVELWIAGTDTSGDSVDVRVLRDTLGMPGEPIDTVVRRLSRNVSVGHLISYPFDPPVLVDSGSFWISVGQLSSRPMNLGADASRTLLVQTSMDPDSASRDRLRLIDPMMAHRVAIRNGSRGEWVRAFDTTTGLRQTFSADSAIEGFSPRTEFVPACGGLVNVFGSQRTWVPIVHPQMLAGVDSVAYYYRIDVPDVSGDGRTDTLTALVNNIGWRAFEVTQIVVQNDSGADFVPLFERSTRGYVPTDSMPWVIQPGQTVKLPIGVYHSDAIRHGTLTVTTTPPAAGKSTATIGGIGFLGVERAPIIAALASVIAYPNPFTDVTMIAAPAASRVEICDLLGRLMRRFARGGAVMWDGRDDAGARVAPGVFVVRAGEAHAEITLMR